MKDWKDVNQKIKDEMWESTRMFMILFLKTTMDKKLLIENGIDPNISEEWNYVYGKYKSKNGK